MNIVSFNYSIGAPFDGYVPSRESILRLEDALRTFPQEEERVTHHFSPGLYARELFIPKGTILTGKIHRHAHLNLVPSGDITVLTEEGVRRVKGPTVLQSFPGMKRAGYAHEDTIWITLHPNPDDERDLQKLEARYIAPNFEAIETASANPQLTGEHA